MTSSERIVTSNNPLPAFTTADPSSESNFPSKIAGTNGTLFREATVDQSHFAPYFPQGVGTSQRMSSTFQKSIPKVTPTVFNGDPLLWLDWIGLFNARIHSSDMTRAEKMTHLQTLVKDQANSSIRGYGYNGDMYFIALKRFKTHLEIQLKLSPLFCNASAATLLHLFDNPILLLPIPIF